MTPDFEDLRAAWLSGPDLATAPGTDALLRSALEADRRLVRRTRSRDLVELVTAIGMAAGLMWVATMAPVRWPWIGAAALCLLVAGVFVREMRRRGRRAAPATVREALERARVEVEHQMALLGSVLVWYLLPIAGAVVLILLGTFLGVRAAVPPDVWARGRSALIGAIAAVGPMIGLVFAAVWWLNRRAVTRHLAPRREAIVDVIRQIDEVDREDGVA